ncbi:Transcription factor 25 [Phlyctochytrium planicorne]|nr:Transcription factor 25 [Phlyctochytrium planicorne]
MSSRAARKLAKLRQDKPSLDVKGGNDHTYEVEEDEGEDEEVPTVKAQKQNLFALLNGGGDDAQDDDDDQEDSTSKLKDAEEEEEEEVEEEVQKPATAKSKKNKKKKKGKGKSKEEPVVDTKEKETGKAKGKGKQAAFNEEDDEVEAALREINEKFGEAASTEPSAAAAAAATAAKSQKTSQIRQPRHKPLLGVDSRFLNADQELRRMFGSKIVADEIKAKRYARQNQNAVPGFGGGGKTNLAQPRDMWPRFDPKLGIGMVMKKAPGGKGEGDDGYGVFQFVHAPQYLELQQIFKICVDSHDPQTLSNLLRSNPYHIDSLLQLSEVARHNNDNAIGVEYIERALYTFERTFHSLFNPSTSLCRLPYQHPPNRSFHLALSRHITNIMKRGCWRTSLEISKYLLALDPEEDPLGAVLMLDWVAIKANEGEWLRRLYTEWGAEGGDIGEGGVIGLPNLEYGIALVEYEMEEKQNKSHTYSTALLRRALISYPLALSLILEKATVTDPGLTASAMFIPMPPPAETEPSEQTVDLLVRIFVERSHPLWKAPEILRWLRDTAKQVVQEVGDDMGGHPDVLKAIKMRRTAYEDGMPLNVARHVVVNEDVKEFVKLLPRWVTGRGMNVFDPIPPPNVVIQDDKDEDGARGGGGDAARTGLLGWLMRNVGDLLRGRGANAGGEEGEMDEDDEDDLEADDSEDEEWEELDKELTKIPLAVEFEKKTKVPKAYAAAGVGAVLFLLIFLNFWGNFLTTLIGFVWPAYQSFKAIESSDKDDDRQWLTYWTVFGALNVLEFFSDILLYWVPFYYVFKAGLIVYLILPQTKGAIVVYNSVLKPYLLKEQSKIDENISKIRTSAANAAADFAKQE